MRDFAKHLESAWFPVTVPLFGVRKKKAFFQASCLPNLSNSSKPENTKAAQAFSNMRSQKIAALAPSMNTTPYHTLEGFTKPAKALSKASSVKSNSRFIMSSALSSSSPSRSWAERAHVRKTVYLSTTSANT